LKQSYSVHPQSSINLSAMHTSSSHVARSGPLGPTVPTIPASRPIPSSGQPTSPFPLPSPTTPTLQANAHELALHNQLLCMLPSQIASFLPYNAALASAALSAGVQSSLMANP